jgi:uncharacterized protein involved in oxidation of intracellular sulfur
MLDQVIAHAGSVPRAAAAQRRVNALIIINDPPYGRERALNGLRLAIALAGQPRTGVRVFLMGGAVLCATDYSLGSMIRLVTQSGGDVGLSGSCMDARGITARHLVAGARRSSLEELADWVASADRIVPF